MKKTLITLLTLSGVAMADSSDLLTLSSPGDTDQAGYTSFDFVLGSNWLTAAGSQASLLPEATTLNLTGITVKVAATWYNQTEAQRSQGAGLAIYEKSGSTWSYVGGSDWQSGYGGTGTLLTFNFDALELSKDTKYTAVFYGNVTAFNALTAESTLNSLVGQQNPTEAAPIAAFGMRCTSSNADFTLYNSTGAAQNVSPYVVFTAKVPEPATATLSLLALAGLATRRKRK